MAICRGTLTTGFRVNRSSDPSLNFAIYLHSIVLETFSKPKMINFVIYYLTFICDDKQKYI